MEVDYRTLRKVVSRVGLEPTTRCLRGSCSTIELPAHGNLEIVTWDIRAPNAEGRPGLKNVAAAWPRFPWRPGAHEPSLRDPAKLPPRGRDHRHGIYHKATRDSRPWAALSPGWCPPKLSGARPKRCRPMNTSRPETNNKVRICCSPRDPGR